MNYVDYVEPNRLPSTIGGNRELYQLYMTSQVSNITSKTNWQVTCFSRLNKKSVKTENKEHIKVILFNYKISTYI